jgi:hypothetical protein
MPIRRISKETFDSITAMIGADCGCTVCGRPINDERPAGKWDIGVATNSDTILAGIECAPCARGNLDDVARKRQTGQRVSNAAAVLVSRVASVVGAPMVLRAASLVSRYFAPAAV